MKHSCHLRVAFPRGAIESDVQTGQAQIAKGQLCPQWNKMSACSVDKLETPCLYDWRPFCKDVLINEHQITPSTEFVRSSTKPSSANWETDQLIGFVETVVTISENERTNQNNNNSNNNRMHSCQNNKQRVIQHDYPPPPPPHTHTSSHQAIKRLTGFRRSAHPDAESF